MAHYGYPTVDSCHGHSCDGAELLVEFAHELCIFRVNMFSMSIFSNHHWSDTQLWPIREAQGTSNPGWFPKPQVFNWSGQGAQVVKTQIALWSSWINPWFRELFWTNPLHRCHRHQLVWALPPASWKWAWSLKDLREMRRLVGKSGEFRWMGWLRSKFQGISWIFHGYFMDI